MADGVSVTRRAVEIGVRLALAWIAIHWLPHVFTNDVHTLWARTRAMGLHRLPYRQVLWEYPPVSLLPVLVAPALARHFEIFRWSFVSLMIAAEYGSLELLRRRHPSVSQSLGRYWHVVTLPLGLFAWFRLDFLSVLPAVVALQALLDDRGATTPLTLGVFAKLWPGVLAVVLAVRRQWRALGVLVAVDVALLAAWVAYSPSGFSAFLRYREGKGFQVESIVGSVLLLAGSKPRVVSLTWVVGSAHAALVGNVLLLIWLALAAVCVALAWRRQPDLVALCGGLVLALVLSSRLLSPQFLVWIVPFVALGWARGERRTAGAFAIAVVMTTLNLGLYNRFVHGNHALQLLMVARNVILVGVAFTLLRLGVGSRPEVS